MKHLFYIMLFAALVSCGKKAEVLPLTKVETNIAPVITVEKITVVDGANLRSQPKLDKALIIGQAKAGSYEVLDKWFDYMPVAVQDGKHAGKAGYIWTSLIQYIGSADIIVNSPKGASLQATEDGKKQICGLANGTHLRQISGGKVIWYKIVGGWINYTAVIK